uniref:Uncharacterized protein n=1 Tax=Arundo donax TaxID=35708 RepID=A0A0A9FD67_ARUDO
MEFTTFNTPHLKKGQNQSRSPIYGAGTHADECRCCAANIRLEPAPRTSCHRRCPAGRIAARCRLSARRS